jgi:hypothetical protein
MSCSAASLAIGLMRWSPCAIRAPQLPGPRGLVAGRNLQYPPGGDMDTAMSLL